MATVQECLDTLNRTSLSESSEARRAALCCITDLFLITADRLSEPDASVFGDVMGRIALDVEEDARVELSNRIAKRSATPRNLAVLLANDHIRVARPVLEYTISLTALDLAAVARSQSQEHLLAIATRVELDSSVTEILVHRGDGRVLSTVANNPGARFSDAGFETLAERAGDNLETVEAIGTRPDLPHHVRENIKVTIGRKFQQEQVAFDIDVSLDDIISAVEKHAADFDMDLIAGTYRNEVEHLYQSGQLQEHTVMRFAKAGRKSSTAYAISLLSGLEIWIVSHCLFLANPVTLAILARALEFNQATFSHLVGLRRSLGTMPADFVANAYNTFETLKTETAQMILQFLKVRIALEQAK